MDTVVRIIAEKLGATIYRMYCINCGKHFAITGDADKTPAVCPFCKSAHVIQVKA